MGFFRTAKHGQITKRALSLVEVHDEFLDPTKGLKRRIMSAGREHKVFG